MKRANFIGAPAHFELNQACRVLVEAFGCHIYLVGSALEKRDYRDVDVRCILPDEDFDRFFPGLHEGDASYLYDAYWSIVCSSITLWLAQHTGLPIDFQIQRQTQANAEFSGIRSVLGIFLDRKPPKTEVATGG